MQIINPQDRGTWTSASNAEADARCPARHAAQRGIPESPPGKDAESGRAIHAVLAAQNTPQYESLYAALTPEQRDTCDRCADIEARKVVEFFGKEASNPSMKVFREQRFWVRFKAPALGGAVLEHSGQPDVVYRFGLRGLIVEYKTLYGDIPEASSNLQCRDQACLIRGQLLLNEIGCVVVQPGTGMNPPICLYHREDLERATKDMLDRVAASNAQNPPRIAGQHQCSYCRAKRECAEYQKWAGAMVPTMLSVLDVPMENWTPQQRAIAADRLSLAQDWLDQVKEFLKSSLVADPASVPGWGLEPGKKRETIKDPQAVFDRFCKLAPNLPVEAQVGAFMATVAVAKGKLKAQVGTVTGLKGKGLESAMQSLCDGLVEITETAPSLKKMDGKG